ncbi:MAG TPA: hypothetical protein VMC08_05150 [Bacteroidales bacterium]|nr:hypothetical protein [Bacteroidales bacterium]
MGIVLTYSAWFILLCILSGLLFSFLFYFRTKKDEIPRVRLLVMAFLRFLTVTLLSFLLLSPLIRQTRQNIEKPIIVVAQDNSGSILAGRDSAYYKQEYPKEMESFIRELQSKYTVQAWSFSTRVADSLPFSYAGKQTDISTVFSEMEARFTNRNVGALVLATDGIYNRGGNPYYSARKAGYPVYCIAMGDTLLHRDVILKNLLYNRTVFLGDKFPVEVWIEANKCAGGKTMLHINKGDQLLLERPITFTRDRELQKISLLLDAKEKGLQHYRVTVDPVNNEYSGQNNSRDLFIEVTETKDKVAILYQVPHPDVSALRQALEEEARFEVKESRIDLFTEDPKKFDLIILDQLPSRQGYSDLKGILASHSSLLFILGTGTDLAAFNSLQTGLQILSDKENYSESVPALNDNFTYFTIDPKLKDLLKEVPPLECPFGTYQGASVSEILLYQKIGNVRSTYPMILFMQSQERKTGIIAGENIWKWRLTEYEQDQGHEIFDGMVGKIAQYLSFHGEKSYFVVKCETSVPEGEKIEFRAELYNESYELVNSQEVKLTLTDENGKSYNFTFAPSDKSYYLDAGALPAGLYKYQATASLGKNHYMRTGEFAVLPVNLEMLNTLADQGLLNRLAADHSGKVFSPHDLNKLSQELLSRNDIRPVAYLQKRFSDLSGNLWVLLVILALAAAEWFLRRRGGMY